MSKQEFINLTGEDPEDMLGGDWQNLIDEWEARNFEGDP